MMLQQQQLYAMRQQQNRELAQDRYDQHQAIHATRLANAEAKRAKRADRIAALKARSDSGQISSNDSETMLVSPVPPPTFE